MRLLLDTNVVLDVMLARQPFAAESAEVMAAVETGRIEAYLCATTITTIHYLSAKSLGRKASEQQIVRLLRIFQIAPVTAAVLSSAIHGKFRDFEDAVLLESARSVSADGIVTRNPSDFTKASDISIHTPADIVKMLRQAMV